MARPTRMPCLKMPSRKSGNSKQNTKTTEADLMISFRCLLCRFGGGMWESNPPWNVLGPKLGFEDR